MVHMAACQRLLEVFKIVINYGACVDAHDIHQMAALPC